MEVRIDPPQDGGANMRADEQLLERAGRGEGPFLRFYQWDGPWISLGRLQDPARALPLPRLEAAGVKWVRRPTGGKALLHDRDLTYSVALPPGHPLLGLSIQRSYEVLSTPFVEVLGHLGVPAVLSESDRASANRADGRRPRGHTAMREWNPPCFTVDEVDAIKIAGRKAIGSAQVRRHGALLQHGSLALRESPLETLMLLYSGAPGGEERFLAELRARTASLEAAGFPALEPRVLIDALIPAFQSLLRP